MEYRFLGNTGLSTGVIGIGGEHLDGAPYSQVDATIGSAIEHGVNIIDVFMPGKQIRENIAKALGAKRKNVIIQGHIGSTDVGQQYDISRDLPTVQRYFEDMLRIFGGHIEIGMMFFIDSDEDYSGVFNTGFADYVLKLKRNGDIGHIGFSSHNPVTAMRAIKTGLPEMLMFSVNPAFDLYPADKNVLDALESEFDRALFTADPERTALYKLCESRGVGITVMKALGAGKLISPEHTPFEVPMTVPQCIHYALTRPAVASVLLGCKTPTEVLNALEYLDSTEQQRDYSDVLGKMKQNFAGNCVYCSHCQPCPAGIDIAAVNKYLDIAKLDLDSVPPSIISHYKSLSNNGADCTACKNCEKRCPFGVKIVENMEEAQRVFG